MYTIVQYLQSIKSVKHNAAMSVYRSILKKSRHIGIGLLQFNPSTVVSLNNVSLDDPSEILCSLDDVSLRA
jgi:hypothetical protein